MPGLHQMLDTKTTSTKLKWWPTPQDYNEAIQTPRLNLLDSELRSGLPYTDAIGLPRPVTGSFASVYRLHCSSKDYAVRLFLRNIDDQEQRYALITDFVQHDDLPYTVTFDFLREGIKVFGNWMPALKMEWVDGTAFDDYIVDNLGNPKKLGMLAENFLVMMNALQRAGIAHGDLQHGNIIMCSDELRLVDYDGMFVPAMHGFEATEIGHRNYQHPLREAKHFGPYLDNFSAWVIYTSIRALQVDSRLMHQLGGGDDCLLFRQTDFQNPLQSPAFSALEKTANDNVVNLARFVRAQLKNDPSRVPFLAEFAPKLTVQLEPLCETAMPLRTGPRLHRGALPDWLEPDNAATLASHWAPSPGQSETLHSTARFVSTNQSAQSSVVHYKHTASQWVKPSNSSTASSSSQISIPLELEQKTPRAVQFWEASGKQSPKTLQIMMIFCPFVWVSIYFFGLAFTEDQDLLTHGKSFPATLERAYTYTSKTTHTHLIYSYTANGKTYTAGTDVNGDQTAVYHEGDKTNIIALPSKPDVHEPVFNTYGAKQIEDLTIACITCMLIAVLEGAIWIPAWNARARARSGIAVVGRVVRLWTEIGAKNRTRYKAKFSYQLNGGQYIRDIELQHLEYASLKEDQEEILVCDNIFPDSFTLYRFLAYHPVLSRTASNAYIASKAAKPNP